MRGVKILVNDKFIIRPLHPDRPFESNIGESFNDIALLCSGPAPLEAFNREPKRNIEILLPKMGSPLSNIVVEGLVVCPKSPQFEYSKCENGTLDKPSSIGFR